MKVLDTMAVEKFSLYDCRILQGENNYLKIENINTSRPIVVPIEFENPSGWEFVGTYALLKRD